MPLLGRARLLLEVGDEQAQQEALTVYAVAAKAAHTSAYGLGHPELAALATERAHWAARLSADPVLDAMAMNLRGRDMWASADWDDSVSVLDRAAAAIEDGNRRGDAATLRMWGSLHLRAAVAESYAGRRVAADDRISLAREAAVRLDGAEARGRDRHELTFSASNVAAHALSVAVEMRDHASALRLHAELSDRDRAEVHTMRPSRLGHWHLDLSRALLWAGRRDDALSELESAEQVAPQLTRNHPAARAALRSLVVAERRSTKERLRSMSNRFALD